MTIQSQELAKVRRSLKEAAEQPVCRVCKPAPSLGYVGDSERAAEREARGEHQAKCPGCGLYRWLSELPSDNEERDRQIYETRERKSRAGKQLSWDAIAAKFCLSKTRVIQIYEREKFRREQAGER